MYCEGNLGTDIEGNQITAWRSIFTNQDDSSLSKQEMQDQFTTKRGLNIQDGQALGENIPSDREQSSLSHAEESPSNSAPKSQNPEVCSERLQLNQLETDYSNQAFDSGSMNNFKRHGRAILTVAQVQAIFRYRSASFAKDSEKAGALARMFGVCVKTVRDIWGGRTWYRATFHLDQSKPFTPERLQKKAGRPKGAKDRKPRARKITIDGGSFDELCYRSESKRSEPPSPGGGAPDADGQVDVDWMDFPAGINAAEGFEDPFEADWNEWLREESERKWEPATPIAFDDDEGEE
jgi:hypothetical protein